MERAFPEITGAFPEITDELVRRHDVPAPRYTSYPTQPVWQPSFGSHAYARKLEEAGERARAPLSLYVHLPFCRSLCSFCGCNVVVAKDSAKADPYLEHVARELELISDRLGGRRRLVQLHWGGGTPTFLDALQIRRLFEAITARFELDAGAEVAIEVNPAVTSVEQLELLRSLGFNRLSMGVQDLDPHVQQAIGRIQSFEETRDLLGRTRELGFRGLNLDMIYGLPHQTPSSWARTLERVLELRPDRLAVYSFAYLPDLKTNQRTIPAEAVPRGRAKLALFGQAHDALVGSGYVPIGMDHFALPEDELARAQAEGTLSRNFQGYTVKAAAADVIAAGATAISDLDGAYAQNVRPLGRYYAAIDDGCFATESGWALTDDDRRRRAIITQLMCHFRVDLGRDATSRFERELGELRALEAEGLLALDETRVELKPLGRVLLRSVAAVFDAHLKADVRRRFSRAV
jgi:oxygen-independent coproporphyrinogen-3 oxidase